MFESKKYKDERDLLEDLISEIKNLQFLMTTLIAVVIALALSGHL